MRYSLPLFALLATATLSIAPAAEVQATPAHTWTHADGRKIVAGINSASATSVTLLLPNGKLGTVDLGKLSEEDRVYVATWLKNNAPPKGFGKADQTIEIVTLKGQMKYDRPTFTVYPGKKIKLILRNADDMHHNLVICKPAKDKGLSVAMEAWKLGADGFAKDWVPKHPSLLFAGKMADPQSTATLYFTAPKKTGSYPYVCTLPGHAQVMNGTMIVSKEVNPLSELTFTTYKGSWNKLPDWSTLKPSATDHVASGKVELGVTKDKENFGLVFNAKLNAPTDGEYAFTIGSDDGSRLLIDGNTVIDHDGIHGNSNKSGKVKLKAGTHDFELQYFEKSGQESLYVGWKAPGMKKEQALSKGGNPGRGGNSPAGNLLVAEDEARIYRNFIAGAGSRGIGVGYPGGLNLAFNANTMDVALWWRGDFIDAARHWNGRGQGHQPPAGDSIANGTGGSPFGILTTSDQAWPTQHLRKDNERPPQSEGGYVFKGYRLSGPARIPTFRYAFGALQVEDTPAPAGNSESADAGFARTLKLTGRPVANLYFRAASGSIEDAGGGKFLIGDQLVMTFKSATPPVLRDANGKKELLIPIKFEGTTATIQQTITWQ